MRKILGDNIAHLGGLDERGMKGSISFMIYGDRLGVLEIELILVYEKVKG
jgi:hypothetical protein